MHRDPQRLKRPGSLALATLALLPLAACDTPRHSNTLIFGTTTKVALDVSQEPTGAMGITLGYKRNEAVWMPLIANQADSNGRMVPSTCTTDACRKLEGEVGGAGGAAGADAKDTYSVLATFSGSMSAAASSPQAKGAVVQYFATGIAARLLAQQGGAAAVSSGADAPASPAVSPEAKAIGVTKRGQVAMIGAKLSRTNGEVSADALGKLLATSPASDIDSLTKADLGKAKTRPALEQYLLEAPEAITSRLYKSLDNL